MLIEHTKRIIRTGEQQDTLTKWAKRHLKQCSRPGVRKKAKQRYSQYERRQSKQKGYGCDY